MFYNDRPIIYQLLDIGTDDQISEVGIRSIIYQTRYFVPNILRDIYEIHFFSGTQVKPRFERAATLEYIEVIRDKKYARMYLCGGHRNPKN